MPKEGIKKEQKVQHETMAIMNVYNVFDSLLRDTTRPWVAPFVWLERRTGVSHVKLLVGCVLAALTYVFASGRMIMLASDLLGFAYPTYASVKFMLREDAQKSPPPPLPAAGQHSDEPRHHGHISPATQWLTYWITFAAVLIVQQLCGEMLQIIPFYFLGKIVFFVWCALPMEANGTAYVHRYVVREHLKRFVE